MGSKFEFPDEAPEKTVPWLAIGIGAALVVMAVIAAMILHDRPRRLQKEAAVAQLEAELKTEQDVLQEQKDKVVEITQQLERLKQAIQLQNVPNAKQAVSDYNQLVKEQNAERDKFASPGGSVQRQARPTKTAGIVGFMTEIIVERWRFCYVQY